MIINVIPQRLIRAAGELRLAERRLIIVASSIEEVIESLKHLGDEPMLIIAAKLSVTLSELRIRIRIIRLMRTALERIAAVYMRTEDNIRSYEEEKLSFTKIKFRPQDLQMLRMKTDKTFEKL